MHTIHSVHNNQTLLDVIDTHFYHHHHPRNRGRVCVCVCPSGYMYI